MGFFTKTYTSWQQELRDTKPFKKLNENILHALEVYVIYRQGGSEHGVAMDQMEKNLGCGPASEESRKIALLANMERPTLIKFYSM